MGQMKPWCKWLPFVFIEWYAKRNCQLTLVNEKFAVIPFKGVYIEAGVSGIEKDGE